MSVLIPQPTPSWKRGFARSRGLSDDPGSWNGLAGAWFPSLGPTGLSLQDVSPFQNHGTLTNMDPAAGWVGASQRGIPWALTLDGVNQFIDINSTLGMAGATALSVTAWIKPTIPFPSFDGIFSLGTGSTQAPWFFGNSGTAAIKVDMDTTAASNDISMTRGALIDDVWQHVAFTWGNQVGTIYVDGVQAGATDTSTGTVVATPVANADIGAVDGAFHATMQIGSVSVWKNRALSANDVLAQFHDPLAVIRLKTRYFPAAAVVAAGTTNPFTMGAVDLFQGKLGV